MALGATLFVANTVFSLVLDLLKVCLSIKLVLSVLQDLLCKSAWLNWLKIRLERSKLVQIVFLQNFPTQPKPVWHVGFYVLFKVQKGKPQPCLDVALYAMCVNLLWDLEVFDFTYT